MTVGIVLALALILPSVYSIAQAQPEYPSAFAYLTVTGGDVPALDGIYLNSYTDDNGNPVFQMNVDGLPVNLYIWCQCVGRQWKWFIGTEVGYPSSSDYWGYCDGTTGIWTFYAGNKPAPVPGVVGTT